MLLFSLTRNFSSGKVACFTRSDSGVRREERKKIRMKRRRGRVEGPPALTATPAPRFFSAYISLSCPYDLYAWNRLEGG